MTDYFVFCEYQDTCAPTAILIPFSNLKPEMLTAFNKLSALGPKIKTHYQSIPHPNGRGASIFAGYEIDDKVDDSKETNDTIGYWTNLLYAIDNDDNDYYPEEFMSYDMTHDKNLSPNELFDKLSSLVEVYETKVNIISCVMVSDYSFDIVKQVQMRFACDETAFNEISEIEQKLKSCDKFSSIQCAQKDDKFCGYGFVKLINNADHALLYKRHMIIDGVLFYFD